MKKDTYLIICTCAIGACITTLIGSHYYHPLSVWGYVISVATGCAIAYLICDFEGVITGVQFAWKKIRTPFIPPTEEQRKKIERDNLLGSFMYYTIAEFDPTAIFIAFVGTIFLCVMYLGIYDVVFKTNIVLIKHDWSLLPTCGLFSLLYLEFCFGLAPSIDSYRVINDNRSNKEIARHIESRKKRLGITNRTPKLIRVLLLNVFIFPFYVTIVNILQLLVLGIRNIKTVIKAVLRAVWWTICLPFKMTWYTLKFVHNDNRLLCLFDTLIGGSVGLYFSSLMAGFCAGAAIGAISCWLKTLTIFRLQPKH